MTKFALLYSNSLSGNAIVAKQSDDQDTIFGEFSIPSQMTLGAEKAVYRKITFEKTKTLIQHIIDETKMEIKL